MLGPRPVVLRESRSESGRRGAGPRPRVAGDGRGAGVSPPRRACPRRCADDEASPPPSARGDSVSTSARDEGGAHSRHRGKTPRFARVSRACTCLGSHGQWWVFLRFRRTSRRGGERTEGARVGMATRAADASRDASRDDGSAETTVILRVAETATRFKHASRSSRRSPWCAGSATSQSALEAPELRQRHGSPWRAVRADEKR